MPSLCATEYIAITWLVASLLITHCQLFLICAHIILFLHALNEQYKVIYMHTRLILCIYLSGGALLLNPSYQLLPRSLRCIVFFTKILQNIRYIALDNLCGHFFLEIFLCFLVFWELLYFIMSIIRDQSRQNLVYFSLHVCFLISVPETIHLISKNGGSSSRVGLSGHL
jgi:hypothetical protein